MRTQPLFSQIAHGAAIQCGRSYAFLAAAAVILVWAVAGPLFGFSDTWQLVINTGTTIITFPMIFLIQNTQNRDNAALQSKLDELIRLTSEARNGAVVLEHGCEADLHDVKDRFAVPGRPARQRLISIQGGRE
jgi:low affinity Fe/Cu permease